MPPFSSIPYAQAPYYCFPIAEISMYILFILCFVHAVKQGIRHISYLLGGLLFGLMLEYINLLSNLGYTYGKFMVMLGHPPLEIPLCIGIGWSIIIYTARLFTDRFQLPLWSAAALDTLLAISIDLSMDVVAYRLHMWNWNWSSRNPLTADWFGVPFDNFFGWLMVVFFYSSVSRSFEAFLYRKKAIAVKFALVPLVSVILSQLFLYVMIVYVDVFLKDNFGITPLHRFITFLIILIMVAGWGIRRRKLPQSSLPVVTWLVPVWFHLFFFTWLFIGGFYRENVWLVLAATLNILLATGVHILSLQKRNERKSISAGTT
jgi:Carotenoid biosynthesis protein